MKKFEIKEGTNKISIHGDRNNEFIKAYLSLSKESKEELGKVLDVTLFDGYNISIKEWS